MYLAHILLMFHRDLIIYNLFGFYCNKSNKINPVVTPVRLSK